MSKLTALWSRRLVPEPLALTLIVILAGTIGWFIPEFYDWTGSDQSRPSPWLWQGLLGLLFAVALFILSLRWLQVLRWHPTPNQLDSPRKPLQFSLQALLIVTTAIGVSICLASRFPISVVLGSVVVAAWFAAWWVWRQPELLLPVVLAVVTMYLPFLWLIREKYVPEIEILVTLPGFVLGVLLQGFAARGALATMNYLWLYSAYASILQFLVCLFLIRLGPKYSISCVLLAMVLSAGGSIALHTLMRA